MKKRSIMAFIRTKKNTGRSLAHQGADGSLCKRREDAPRFSSFTIHVSVVRHPMLQGIGSLGNVSGGYVRFDSYLRGNFVSDIRRDWERVSECINDSMKTIR